MRRRTAIGDESGTEPTGGTLGSSAGGPYPWMVMVSVLSASFMAYLDSTVVNVALPGIARSLGRADGIDWVATAYLLSLGAVQPVTGWLALRYGKKPVFLLAVTTFLLGSALCAAAPTLGTLVAFRVVQGAGAGIMMPVAIGIVYDVFPPRGRGRMMGYWGMASQLAPALGPVVGGALVTAASWRWVFVINLPIGAASLVATWRIVRSEAELVKRRLDWVGLSIAPLSLALLLYGLSEAGERGWASPQVLSLLAASLIGLALFAWWELYTEEALMDLSIYKWPAFSLGVAVMWLLSMYQFGRLVFLPLELETLRGYTAFTVGLVLVVPAFMVAVSMPFAGRLTDRVGPRLPVVAGLLPGALSAWLLAQLAPGTPLLAIVGILVLQGIGVGFATMPNHVAALNAVPSSLAPQASSGLLLARHAGGAFGVAAMASLVRGRMGGLSAEGVAPAVAQSAYNSVFVFAFAGLVVAFALAFLLPGKERTAVILDQRAREQRGIMERGQ